MIYIYVYEDVFVDEISENEDSIYCPCHGKRGRKMDDTLRKICQEIAESTGDISRKEISAALKLFKQKEREQQQEDYEEQLNCETAALLTLSMEQNQVKMEEKVENILEKIQNMAFKDGFRYAISMLEESVR